MKTGVEQYWDAGRKPPGDAIRWLMLLGMTVALCMLVLGAIMLYGARQDAWRQAEQASSNLTMALERDITRNIAVYDLSLQGAVEALHQPGIDQVSPEIRQSAVFDRATSAEYLGSLVILDKTGSIVADSTSIVPHRLNLGDREYFRIHQDRADAGLFVSQPFRSRMRGGDASIAISRRISGPDGEFEGVVVGGLRLAYFRDLFGTLNLGANGAVTLLRLDGKLIARTPFNEADLNLDISKSDVVRRYQKGQSGQFTANSPIDGVQRLVTYRQVGVLPLILSVAKSTDDIYAAWRQKAVFIGSIMVSLCAATIILSLLFRQELLRRLAAEVALIDVAGQLSVAAATDGLTGLANRRAFEAKLLLEWKRAIRGHTSIGLLMIDVDHFKAYNDLYGHQGGDRALQAIAASIQHGIHRPADLVARYGGEEFVVLLPETDALGALAIGERIRGAVAGLDVLHGGAPGGRVTASIGVAVAYCEIGQCEATLLQEADAALYVAKRAGRNRVVLAAASALPAPIELPTLRSAACQAD